MEMIISNVVPEGALTKNVSILNFESLYNFNVRLASRVPPTVIRKSTQVSAWHCISINLNPRDSSDFLKASKHLIYAF